LSAQSASLGQVRMWPLNIQAAKQLLGDSLKVGVAKKWHFS